MIMQNFWIALLAIVILGSSCKEREKKAQNTQGAELRSCTEIVNYSQCQERTDCEYLNGRCQFRSQSGRPSGLDDSTTRRTCSQQLNQSDCQRNNCSWVNNQCLESGQGQDCSSLQDQTQCINASCRWDGSRCLQKAQCQGLTQLQCQPSMGCQWNTASRTCMEQVGSELCQQFTQTQCNQNLTQCLWDPTTLSCRDRTGSGSGNCTQYGGNREMCEQDSQCQWIQRRHLIFFWVEECRAI
jgi:hypothetical protein